MYRVTRTSHDDSSWRLASSAPLSADSFRAIAAEIGARPVRARKIGRIAARRATSPEHVETRWNGKETEAEAAIGDWVVTALATDGTLLRDAGGNPNVYVIKADRLPELYEPEIDAPSTRNGDVYRPKGIVDAIRLRGGFEIFAPWGEMQRAPDGWLLLNGSEVYGNQTETFAAGYAIVG